MIRLYRVASYTNSFYPVPGSTCIIDFAKHCLIRVTSLAVIEMHMGCSRMVTLHRFRLSKDFRLANKST